MKEAAALDGGDFPGLLRGQRPLCFPSSLSVSGLYLSSLSLLPLCLVSSPIQVLKVSVNTVTSLCSCISMPAAHVQAVRAKCARRRSMQATQPLPTTAQLLRGGVTRALSRAQVYNPEEGPLERRVNTQWLDGMFEGEVDLEHTDYWFTEPAGARRRLCSVALCALCTGDSAMPARPRLAARLGSALPPPGVPGYGRAWKRLRAGLSICRATSQCCAWCGSWCTRVRVASVHRISVWCRAVG